MTVRAYDSRSMSEWKAPQQMSLRRSASSSPCLRIPAAHTVKKYLTTDLRIDVLIEFQLLLLTFITGIQDVISFPDFHCFVSNQTGNSVVLAIGAARLGNKDLFSLPNIATSLGCFVAGALLTGQIANLVGPRRRYWLLISHVSQTIMAFGAAAIQIRNHDRGFNAAALGSVAVLAFSSGAQVASMRPMKIPEITTAMATAAWVDLLIDPELVAVQNRPRDRRAAFLIALIAGSFVGAFIYKSVGSGNTLLVCGAGKALVSFTLLLNSGKATRPINLSDAV